MGEIREIKEICEDRYAVRFQGMTSRVRRCNYGMVERDAPAGSRVVRSLCDSLRVGLKQYSDTTARDYEGKR